MGKPVKSYTVDGGDIEFQLDFTHYSKNTDGLEPVHYQLDCMTRAITSSEGRGVLYRLLGEGHVLGYFQKNGGIQGMAELAEAENLGRCMRYDGTGETWRIFDTKSGIWREQTTPDEPIKKLSQFLKRLLVPIQEHAEYLGAKEFDWLRGQYVSSDIGADLEDEIVMTDDSEEDENVEDGTGSASEEGRTHKKKQRHQNHKGRAKKKKMHHLSCPEEPAGNALKQLKATIYQYVETPKHAAEVLKPLQHMLAADFSISRDKLHLLPCPNGVVNLKTGELLSKAAPDDLFTHACATEYDPDADIGPARAFFENFFPMQAYEVEGEQQALVRCLQQWFGYCLTLETALELCVWFHGPGSNGKTVIAKLVEEVFGKVENGGIHSAIPIAALCRARGENNGSLSDARHARHVTVSESDKSTKTNEAALRSLISGETQHFKQMYGKEVKCTPKLKLSMFVNWLPTWEDSGAHANRRRHIYVPMMRIFVNPNDPADKIQVEEYKAQGKPECLIAEKNVRYFEQQVLPHLQGFLRFFVLGAMEYYKSGAIEIPQSLKEYQKQELSDKPGAVAEYVDEHLQLTPGAKLLQRDILTDFRNVTQIEELTFKAKDFNEALKNAIAEKSVEWQSPHVKYYNGRDGSGRPQKDCKGMLWEGITFRDTNKAPWNRGRVGR